MTDKKIFFHLWRIYQRIFKQNYIHKSFIKGKNFKIGKFCIIEEGVICGDDVSLKNYVLLQENTCIFNGVSIDSFVKSSGDNVVGSNTTLRFNSTICRNIHIGHNCFLSPNVMTIFSDVKGDHSKYIKIEKNCYIGTNAVIGPGVHIGHNTIIGAMSFVNKNCDKNSTYIGIPAKKVINKND